MRVPAGFVRPLAIVLLFATLGPSPSAQLPAVLPGPLSKLDPILQDRTLLVTGRSRVIVRAIDGESLAPVVTLIRQVGGVLGVALPIINSQAAIVPNTSLAVLAMSPLVEHLSLDRPIAGAMERTGATVGATTVREQLELDGSGIGVAIIDSGVTPWHDDLATAAGGAQRVDRFVDFVGGGQAPHDDYGHGTHVAGIIGGNGFDSNGARSGVAPGAHLVVLKVLDASGRGRISDVIAALEYVVLQRESLNIRIVNMSIATGVYESYHRDPLTRAALVAVRAGIVVVAAAGNNGRSQEGRTRYGGITAPGNAPWVLTVGASSHAGTVSRADDSIAAFSSRGPTAVDRLAKPDLVAPGVGVESLSDPNSAFYTTKAPYLLAGMAATSYLPYLSLSGTSMATPVVSGTVALMLQANPALTPNAIKAILQYTATRDGGWDLLTQGAGFLDAEGAVRLARFLAEPSTGPYPSSPSWGRQIVWGNYLAQGGRITADANAWETDLPWGATTAVNGQPIALGVTCSPGACDAGEGTWKAWRVTVSSPNVVWGDACGGANCSDGSSTFAASDGETVVWGTEDSETVVWGTNDADTVVWGTGCDDDSCEPVIWSEP